MQIKARSKPLQIKARTGPKKVKAFAYSGGLMKVSSGKWWIIDLAGLSINASQPFLLEHSQPQLGEGTATSDGESLSVSGEINTDLLPDSPPQWQASIGVTSTQYTAHKAGDLVEVNGQTLRPTMPFSVAHKSTLDEVSIVAQGADQSTSVSIAAAAAQRIKQMFGLSKSKLPAETPTDDQIQRIESMASREPACGWADEKAVELLATQTLSGELDFGQFAEGISQQIEASYRAEGLRNKHAHLEAANSNASSPGAYAEPAKSSDVLTAALLIKANQGGAASSNFSDNILNQAEAISKWSSQQILAAAYEAEGKRQIAKDIRAGVGFTTIGSEGLPGVWRDSLHKSIEQRFMEYPQTWKAIFDTKTHSDFFAHSGLRGFGTKGLQPVAEDGEIKHGGIGSHEYVTKVSDTFAEMITLTRNQLIQDSAGFLNDIPGILAQNASRLVSRVAYETLLGAGAFFSVGNGNLLTGANSALSVDSLSDAVRLLRLQVDEAGEAISMIPQTLTVPPQLEDLAQQILVSRELRHDTASVGTMPTGNPHAVRNLKLSVEPRLQNTNYANSSPTGWYLSASPSAMAGCMTFLNSEAPQVDISTAPELDFNKLVGAAFRIVQDVTGSMLEHRAIVRSTGA